MWRKVFAVVEGEAFAGKVVVKTELRKGFGPSVSGAKKQHKMLYWSVQII